VAATAGNVLEAVPELAGLRGQAPGLAGRIGALLRAGDG
jgi:hypothetical protein